MKDIQRNTKNKQTKHHKDSQRNKKKSPKQKQKNKKAKLLPIATAEKDTLGSHPESVTHLMLTSLQRQGSGTTAEQT